MKIDYCRPKQNLSAIVKLAVFPYFILLLVFMSGCGNEAYVKAKITRPIQLTGMSTAETTVYLDAKSEVDSGGEALSLHSALETALSAKGFKVVNVPEKADLNLTINVLFANNLRVAQSIAAATTISSAGAKAGLGEVQDIAVKQTAMSLKGIPTATGQSGSYARSVGDATKTGLIEGATVALISGVASSLTKDDIYRAIIDVAVKENGSTVRRIESENIEDLDNPGLMSQDDFSESPAQRTRVFTEAVGNGLTLEEAIPMLQVASVNKIIELIDTKESN